MPNPVIDAIWNEDANALENCLRAGGDANAEENGTRALDWACLVCNSKLVDLLIEYGAEVNHKSPDRSTPVQSAAYLGCAEAVKALLDAGARVADIVGDTGQTAFMLAAKAGKLEITKLLVAHGADPYARDKRGGTAFHWAVTENDSPEMAAYLLSLGLDPRATDSFGLSAVDAAGKLNRSKMLKVMEAA